LSDFDVDVASARHLSNEHAQAQAARLNFGPSVVPLPQAATA
jgi:hypothetical protein